MAWLRRAKPPAALHGALAKADRLLAGSQLTDGRTVAASRFGFWVGQASEFALHKWHEISKAQLSEQRLQITLTEQVAQWPDGIIVTRDLPVATFELDRLSRLTDVVHDRVRGSVAKSLRIEHRAGSGYLALRRVAGKDGLLCQFRADPNADITAADLVAAVRSAAAQSWPDATARISTP